MTRKIPRCELQQIRKEIAALSDQVNPSSPLFAAVVLPEPCDKETLDFALELCSLLGKINCQAMVSEILHFPFRAATSKNYEVMAGMPLGIPCIRVYPKARQLQTSVLQCIKNPITQ